MLKNIAICSLLLLSLLAPEPALACSCIEPPPPQEAAQQAAAVFTGTVLSVTQVENQQEVRIRVERVWKGVRCGEVTIVTPLNEAACGFTFQTGQSYLVYAERQKGKLSTNLCTRTKLTSQASEDLAALGEPQQVCQ
jgi:putative component of toxin-antitoxin plasmid stabilization module